MQTSALNAAPVLHSGDPGLDSWTSGLLNWQRFSLAFLSSLHRCCDSVFKHYMNAFLHFLSDTSFTVTLLFNAVKSVQMGKKDVKQVVAIGHVHMYNSYGFHFYSRGTLFDYRPTSYIPQFTRINSGNTTLRRERLLPSNIFKFRVWISVYSIQ
jgi:hypothetical protein